MANPSVALFIVILIMAVFMLCVSEYTHHTARQRKMARLADLDNARKAIASITMTPERAAIFQQLGYDVTIDGDKRRAVVSHPQRTYETTRIYALSGFID